MIVDWDSLVYEVDAVTTGGTAVAQRALEHLLGAEAIASAVECAIEPRVGSLLASDVLRHLQSRRATELAYQAYKVSTGGRAQRAVGLIKDIGHPNALAWVSEFLADANVADQGIGVLDALVWHNYFVDDPRVEQLLRAADEHPSAFVREMAAHIRSYLHEK